MTQLTIRGVPEFDLAALREEAATTGRSLNSIVCAAIAEHVDRERRRQALAEAIPEIRAFREQLRLKHGGDFSDSTPLIRADRDR
jgi:plasmid stability protein